MKRGPARLRWSPRRLLRLIESTHHTVKKIESTLEDMMATDQERADALAERIDTATTNIRQDIADLKTAHPEVDFSRLENSVGGIEGLDAENPAPEPEQPTE